MKNLTFVFYPSNIPKGLGDNSNFVHHHPSKKKNTNKDITAAERHEKDKALKRCADTHIPVTSRGKP